MKKKNHVLEQFKLWDIPNTMVDSFKAIVKKYPNKPIWIIVWEPGEKKENYEWND